MQDYQREEPPGYRHQNSNKAKKHNQSKSIKNNDSNINIIEDRNHKQHHSVLPTKPPHKKNSEQNDQPRKVNPRKHKGKSTQNEEEEEDTIKDNINMNLNRNAEYLDTGQSQSEGVMITKAGNKRKEEEEEEPFVFPFYLAYFIWIINLFFPGIGTMLSVCGMTDGLWRTTFCCSGAYQILTFIIIVGWCYAWIDSCFFISAAHSKWTFEEYYRRSKCASNSLEKGKCNASENRNNNKVVGDHPDSNPLNASNYKRNWHADQIPQNRLNSEHDKMYSSYHSRQRLNQNHKITSEVLLNLAQNKAVQNNNKEITN